MPSITNNYSGSLSFSFNASLCLSLCFFLTLFLPLCFLCSINDTLLATRDIDCLLSGVASQRRLSFLASPIKSLSVPHSLFFILSDLPSPPLCSSDASFRLPMCMSVKHFTFHGGIINCVTNATRQLKCNKQVIIASVHGTQSYCIYSTVLYVSYVDRPTLTSALGRHISGGALTRSTCSSASDEVYYVIST